MSEKAGEVANGTRDAISAEPAKLAFEIGRRQVAYGRRDLGEVSSAAVSDAYCICVAAGEAMPSKAASRLSIRT